MNGSYHEPSPGAPASCRHVAPKWRKKLADKMPVLPEMPPSWSIFIKRARKSIEALPGLWLALVAWFAPCPPWRRYRVTPRMNPAVFRRELLRAIRGELRRSGLNPVHVSRGTTC